MMEYAFRLKELDTVIDLIIYVAILVMMEYAFRPGREPQFNFSINNVAILVMMEYAFRRLLIPKKPC